MALITLTHQQSITVQLACARSWALPISGEIGQASFFLPYSSPAAADVYLNDEGGSLITVGSEYDSGEWRGIVTGIDYQENGIQVTAHHPIIILKYRPVARELVIAVGNSGYIAKQALLQAIGGMTGYPLGIGPVAETAPTLSEFAFTGENCWSVLENLMSLSSSEVGIQSFSSVAISSGRGNVVYNEAQNSYDLVTWGPPLSYGYPGLLLAPGTLRSAKYTMNVTERSADVLSISDNMWYRVTDARSAGDARWPAKTVIKEKQSSIAAVRARGESEMLRRTNALIEVSGDVTTNDWAIREGDTVRAMIPWARFTGVTFLARVMKRSINDQNGLMSLTLLIANEAAEEAVKTGGGKAARGRWWRSWMATQRNAERGKRYLSQ